MSLLRDGVFNRAYTRLRFPGLRVVLTRFNMATGDPWSRAVRAPAEMAAWMAHRAPIFERTCLASMRAQSEPPDLWLIGFDEAHKASAEGVLATFADLPWAKPVWQELGADGAYESISATFARGLRPYVGAHEYVMTTRFDNDDALGLSYMAYARMYAAAILQNKHAVGEFWLSFPMGGVWNGTLQIAPYPTNPFLTRIERIGQLGSPHFSALGVKHNDVFDAGAPVFQAATTQMMWLRVMHGQNVTGGGASGLHLVANAQDELRRWFAIESDPLSL